MWINLYFCIELFNVVIKFYKRVFNINVLNEVLFLKVLWGCYLFFMLIKNCIFYNNVCDILVILFDLIKVELIIMNMIFVIREVFFCLYGF